MRISHICVETRAGHKTMVNTLYANKLEYTKANIPRLLIDCGITPTILYTGAILPTPGYEPNRDTVMVELVYDDGTTERPYSRGHVNLSDLYDRLSHPEKILETKTAES